MLDRQRLRAPSAPTELELLCASVEHPFALETRKHEPDTTVWRCLCGESRGMLFFLRARRVA